MESSPQSIYERERREKLQKLRDLGVEPFGGRTAGITPLAQIKALYNAEMGHDGGPVVKAAGRVMLIRDHKKLKFHTLRDESGDLQIGLEIKRLSERDWQVVELLDLGDQVVVEGPLGTTKRGEITIWASQISMASKALLPPPAKWEGLSDVELRYRQRYVDLWANPQVLRTLKLRMAIVDEVRAFLRSKGFVEVETPMMQALAGGAAARPFVTHHNALDIPLYMRIAPELYLKRLLVGGFTKVFELNRNFRNEGISPRHNPEFTMLEAYEAFGSWETMADLVEEMICGIAEKLFGGLKIEHKNAAGEVTKTINLQRPWRRVALIDLVANWTRNNIGIEWRFDKKRIRDTERGMEILGALCRAAVDGESLAKWAKDAHAQYPGDEMTQDQMIKSWASSSHASSAFRATLEALSPAEQLQKVYEKFVEPTLIDPTYVTHVPSVIIPLARKAKDDPFFADVYELAINGQEISPGYTELNDPDVQAENFTNQVGQDQQQVDHDFLTALRYGMPPAGGMGLGIDRLVMMLTGAESIRDVILFPLMKPQDKDAKQAEEPANPT